MSKIQVKLSGPDISEADIAAVNEVLTSGWLSLGPKLGEFEDAFADYVGAKYAVGCNSGTSALHMMMVSAGVGPGDEVITSPFSFIASANCIEMVGAKCVFADIDEESMNLDPERIREAITPKTKAILSVHIFGLSADSDAIGAIAKEHDLIVLEDACESLGAVYKGRKVGNGEAGLAAAWGFYPNKQMTTGEGGMVTTNDESFALSIKALRNQGRNPQSSWLEHDVLGYNFRIDEMSCALGLSQILRIEEILGRREAVAAKYTERLSGLASELTPLQAPPKNDKRSWFVYPVEFRNGISRDAIAESLLNDGVQTGRYFVPPIHLQKVYIEKYGYKPGDFQVCERVSDRILALPFHGLMSDEDIDYTCESLRRAIKNAS